MKKYLSTTIFLFPPIFYCWYAFDFAHIRPVVQNIWAADLWVLANSGYHLLQGLWPHTDYFAPVGLTYSAVAAAGLWLKDMNIEGILLSMDLVGVVFSSLLFFQLRKNTNFFIAFFIGYLCLEACISLRPISHQNNLITPSGAYNKLGWAIMMTCFADMLFRPFKKISGYYFGIAGTALFFLKANFFAAWVVMFFAGIISVADKSFIFRSITSLAASTSLVFLLTPIQINDYLRDFFTIGTATETQNKIKVLFQSLGANLVTIALNIVALLAQIVLSRQPLKSNMKLMTVLIGVSVAGIVASIGSLGLSELPLLFMLPIVGFLLSEASRVRRVAIFSMSSLVILFWPTLFFVDNHFNLQVRRILAEDIKNGIPHYQSVAPNFKNYYFIVDRYNPTKEMMYHYLKSAKRNQEMSPAVEAFWADHAYDLAQFVSFEKSKSFATLDWVNFLPFMLNQKFPKNEPLFLHLGRVVKAESLPDPSISLGDVDYIMVPRISFSDTQAALIEKYRNYIQSHYTPIAHNDFWQLFRRTN